MTDRELLELAAKAAGLTFVDGESWDEGAGWNPLTDDGDALRLAVKLKGTLEFDFDRVDVFSGESHTTEYLYDKPQPTDPYAATRRAIVRAAAEIGKELR